MQPKYGYTPPIAEYILASLNAFDNAKDIRNSIYILYILYILSY